MGKGSFGMTHSRTLGGLILPVALLFIGAHFTFTAVQGQYGLFQRIQIEAEAARLDSQRAETAAEVARMEHLTRRLSDEFLDIDLLDQQLRDVLGYARADEIILP
jgi:cell division protein FtsB